MLKLTIAQRGLQGDVKKFMKSLGIKDANNKTEPQGWIVPDKSLPKDSDRFSKESDSQEESASDEEESEEEGNRLDQKLKANINAQATSKKKGNASKFVSIYRRPYAS
jgi:hypothetical protein